MAAPCPRRSSKKREPAWHEQSRGAAHTYRLLAVSSKGQMNRRNTHAQQFRSSGLCQLLSSCLLDDFRWKTSTRNSGGFLHPTGDSYELPVLVKGVFKSERAGTIFGRRYMGDGNRVQNHANACQFESIPAPELSITHKYLSLLSYDSLPSTRIVAARCSMGSKTAKPMSGRPLSRKGEIGSANLSFAVMSTAFECRHVACWP